jgi:threonine/homoserine/homoserine lactone efflux protein
MLENWFFLMAVFAVLMIPGPTNALLASSAHQQGIAKTSFYIPVQLVGYLYAINLWALFIHLMQPIWPRISLIAHILSSLYTVVWAFYLWKAKHLQKHSQRYQAIKLYQLFFATLKNPKALLFAAGIFPLQTWDHPYNTLLVFAWFSVILIPTAIFWMCFGRALLDPENSPKNADRLYKGSAVLLMVCVLPVLIGLF